LGKNDVKFLTIKRICYEKDYDEKNSEQLNE